MFINVYIYFLDYTLYIYIYIYIYNKLDLNKQVTYIYCESNIYLKLFLCATTLSK